MLPTSDLYKQAIVASTRSTTASVYFGLYDVTAKDDANPTAQNGQPFTSPSGLVDNIRTPPINVATLEENYFRLDGSFLTTPSDLSPTSLLGWWSLEQSGVDRTFENNPIISIAFSELHSSLGGELFFDKVGGSYCEAFKVTWLNGSTILTEEFVEGNTEARYYIDTPIENYNKMTIELMRTDKPYRYARLNEVNFGGEEIFDNNNLISAKITEEVDPVSATLSLNKLVMTVLNVDQKFNMINPMGVYKLLQKRQQLIASTGIKLPNGTISELPLGTFYLSNWKNSTGMTATLEATDAVGLLDRTTYYRSPFWVNEPIANVVNHILADAGTFPHTITPEVATEVVNGYIPVLSHRMALQLVLIASRATVKSDRAGVLNIFRPKYTIVDKVVDYEVIIGTPQIEQKTLITSVTADEVTYEPHSEHEELSKSTFDITGTQTLTIPYTKAPASEVTVNLLGSGFIVGTPSCSSTTAVVVVSGTGQVTVTVTGRVYDKTTKIVTASIPILSAGEVHQTASIADNPLICGTGKAQLVTQHMLDYYQRRIKQTLNYWVDPALQSGDCVSIETMFGGGQIGVIERQEVQFVPSLKSKLEVVG